MTPGRWEFTRTWHKLDEVFGAEHFVSQISFQTTSGFETETIGSVCDFLLWYAKDKSHVKLNQLYEDQPVVLGKGNARWVLLQDRSSRSVAAAEMRGDANIPDGARLYKPGDLQSQGGAKVPQRFEFQGEVYAPDRTSHWKANFPAGMKRLAGAGGIHVAKVASSTEDSSTISLIRFAETCGPTLSPAVSPMRRSTWFRPTPK